MFEGLKHHLNIAVDAWRNERAEAKTNKGKSKRGKDDLQFMPAALEVMETPASPLGRWIALSISALFLISILWSVLGELDTHATAQSQIIPSGRTKVIQSLGIGVVKALKVKDGQKVKKGDVLIQLDSTATSADTDRLESDLVELRLTEARLKAHLSGQVNLVKAFQPPKGAPQNLVRLHERLLLTSLEEQRARLQSLKNQLGQRQNEKKGTQTNIQRLKLTMPLMAERVAGIKELTEKGHFPRLRYLEIQQEFIDQQKELELQSHKLNESSSAIAAVGEQINQAKAEFRRGALDELKNTEREAAALDQELIKAQQRGRLTTLTAPITGFVQQLVVHTIGGVVQPAEPLMMIVPEDSKLELEARILNKDIGFVHTGQKVEIKLETFPFTKYGSVPGVVLHISGDAIQDEKLGPVYLARVSVGKTHMAVNGQQVAITPGMAATAEIKTGKRQLIEYVMAPLFRYQDEALRER
jgi:hemolysin D